MLQVPLGIGYSGSHQHLGNTALYTFVIFRPIYDYKCKVLT
jgi:hypothetical protein